MMMPQFHAISSKSLVRHEVEHRRPGRLRLRRGLLGTGLAAGLLLTGACGGGDDDKATDSSASATQSPTPSGNGLGDMTPQEFVTTVQTATKQASSVHIRGAMTDEQGLPLKMDLRVGTDRGQGTLTAAVTGSTVATMQLICVSGKLYIKSPELWRAVGGEEAYKLVGDRWGIFPTTGQEGSSLKPFCSISAMTSDILTPRGGVQSLTKVAPTTINGQPVAGLKDTDGSVLYAASTGTAYPVRIGSPDKPAEAMDFSEWNAALQVTAPPDAVDFEKMGQ